MDDRPAEAEDARIAALAELRAAPADEEIRKLLAMAHIAGGHPDDDDPEGFDAQVGREFIRLRHKIAGALSELERERDEARETISDAIAMLDRYDAPARDEGDGGPLSIAGRVEAMVYAKALDENSRLRAAGRALEAQARVAALEAGLRELADSLEEEIKGRADNELPRRIARDLEPVRAARALLEANSHD
jgi:type IV secretory pathway VirJ component